MIEATRGHILLAGVATRALAVSAAKVGYRVSAADAFGDLDLRAVAEVISIPRPLGHFRPGLAAAAAAGVPASMAAYTSSFENNPAAVARLSHGRRLLGNTPAVLRRVRNPIELMRLLRDGGFAIPETRASAARRSPGRAAWLLKPRRSGGGHGIKAWRAAQPVPRGAYLQERIVGVPGSIVFAADGRGAVTLGLSRQLVGDVRLGAAGFRYCGSLLASSGTPLFPNQEELLERAGAVAAMVTHQFGLVGLNGIDFIARNGVPYPVEVNPRYSASMELVERAGSISLFEVHARACDGLLPRPITADTRVHGKAIVFARHDVRLGNTQSWVGQASLADVPHSGEKIRRGQPICTVFAEARSGEACRRLLLQRAAEIYRIVESRKRRVA
jgi:predicted ATP-grasp superfamily ATP-dependent carboligase